MDPVIITVSYEQRRKILAGLNHDLVRFALDAEGSFWLKAYPWIVFQPLMTPERITVRDRHEGEPREHGALASAIESA